MYFIVFKKVVDVTPIWSGGQRLFLACDRHPPDLIDKFFPNILGSLVKPLAKFPQLTYVELSKKPAERVPSTPPATPV